MAKLQDMFSQARRAQNGGGMGFLGKSKPETKARAAALIVEVTRIASGSAEAALKAGADGVLFHWDGKDAAQLETLEQETKAAQASKEDTVTGLHITAGWDKLDQDTFKQLKEAGVQYVILPFNAPARLLTVESKDLEKVVTVPMQKGETYPLYIHNLTAFDGIAAAMLDFQLPDAIGTMSIEEVLDYRAVREAVRFPSMIHVKNTVSEADIYTIRTLDVQALVLTADNVTETTKKHIKNLRELLEKVHLDEKERENPSVTSIK
ncbi:MAG TPA: hypothetical protein VL461_13505 [Dictyobacter sp.]|jgi:2-methylisocitrate lyase-like PEP mutase family enzyme|nr:hypothetical protein [Dictyobacter sp.]